MMSHSNSDDIYPADIAPVARAMDRLAEADASCAPADLEQRVLRAAPLARRAPALRMSSAAMRPWWSLASLRLAAAIAIIAGVGAGWLALRSGPPGDRAPTLEEEVDAWLAMAGADDSFQAEIETLLLLNADLASTFDSGWIEDDLIGDSL
ncbi:MAG: hypothetical protein ACF8R7_16555 [Phycisphaerales bacterium JB039]